MSQVATITRLREEQVCLVIPPDSTLFDSNLCLVPKEESDRRVATEREELLRSFRDTALNASAAADTSLLPLIPHTVAAPHAAATPGTNLKSQPLTLWRNQTGRKSSVKSNAEGLTRYHVQGRRRNQLLYHYAIAEVTHCKARCFPCISTLTTSRPITPGSAVNVTACALTFTFSQTHHRLLSESLHSVYLSKMS